MGSAVSSPYLAGSSDRLPNQGISKIYLPVDLTGTTRDWILQALEHRFYHRYIQAEDILLRLISHVATIRDFIHALIHLAALRFEMGFHIPQIHMVTLSRRLSVLHNIKLPETPQVWAAVDKWRLKSEVPDPPLESRLDVEAIELGSITESERDLIIILGLPITVVLAEYDEKEEFLVDIFKRRCASQSPTEPWLEHELYIHYFYHVHIFDMGKNSVGSQKNVQLIAVINRLVAEQRFDAVFDFQDFLSDHARYRDRVKPLYISMLGHPSITKHQHASGRMFIASTSAYVRETHILEDEIRRLMKECNDPLYSTVPEIARWPREFRAYTNHSRKGVVDMAIKGLNQMSGEADTLIALKCYRQAATRLRLTIIGHVCSDLELEYNRFFRSELIRLVNLQCGTLGLSIESAFTLFSTCLAEAIETGEEKPEKVANTISVIRYFHGGSPGSNNGGSWWQPWTGEGMVKMAWEISNQVEKAFIGSPLATEAGRFAFEQTQLVYPGSVRESSAALNYLQQLIERAGNIWIPQTPAHLTEVIAACDEAEEFGFKWIEIDRNYERYDLAFEKAFYLAHLVFVDPNRYMACKQSGGGTKAYTLMYEMNKKEKWMSTQETHQTRQMTKWRNMWDEFDGPGLVCKFYGE